MKSAVPRNPTNPQRNEGVPEPWTDGISIPLLSMQLCPAFCRDVYVPCTCWGWPSCIPHRKDTCTFLLLCFFASSSSHQKGVLTLAFPSHHAWWMFLVLVLWELQTQSGFKDHDHRPAVVSDGRTDASTNAWWKRGLHRRTCASVHRPAESLDGEYEAGLVTKQGFYSFCVCAVWTKWLLEYTDRPDICTCVHVCMCARLFVPLEVPIRKLAACDAGEPHFVCSLWLYVWIV